MKLKHLAPLLILPFLAKPVSAGIPLELGDEYHTPPMTGCYTPSKYFSEIGSRRAKTIYAGTTQDDQFVALIYDPTSGLRYEIMTVEDKMCVTLVIKYYQDYSNAGGSK